MTTYGRRGSKSGCGVLSPFSMMAFHSLLSSGTYLLYLLVTKFYPLGKTSKYRVTPMPRPINQVPIFSDSVSIGTDFIGTD